MSLDAQTVRVRVGLSIRGIFMSSLIQRRAGFMRRARTTRTTRPRRARTWRDGFTDPVFVVAIICVAIPPLWALVGVLAHGFFPEGDDAIIALRVADVFSQHAPVMGQRSTSGLYDASLAAHHPGPLEYYLLAIPTWIFRGSPFGLALACGVLSLAASIASLVWARRLGGRAVLVSATVGLLAVQWSLGTEGLIRPFNPFPPLLPTYLLMFLTWALLRRDLRAMWPFALCLSLLAQANLSYLPLVAVFLVVMVVIGLVRWRAKREVMWPRRGWGPRRRTGVLRSEGWRTVAVVLLAWLPSVVELATYSPNNLAQVLRVVADASTPQIGLVDALGRLAPLAPLPGGFGRMSMDFADSSTLAKAVGLVVVGLLIVAALPFSRSVLARSALAVKDPERRAAVDAVRVALLACAGMLLVIASVPADRPTAWYWISPFVPVAAFAWVALVARFVPAGWVGGLPARGSAMVAAALVGLSLLAVATGEAPRWPAYQDAERVAGVVERHARDHVRPGGSIVILGVGTASWLSLSHSAAYGLERQGFRAHHLSDWPIAEDTDFRQIATAPAGSPQYVLQDKGAPSVGELVARVPVTSTDYRRETSTVGIYWVPPKPR